VAFVADPVTASDAGDVVVVFDRACEEQDIEETDRLATDLTRDLGCVGVTVMNHDDDMLVYQVHSRGALVDEYFSNPRLFDPSASRIRACSTRPRRPVLKGGIRRWCVSCSTQPMRCGHFRRR
jgi:hypothetical protein